jgi:uncharacterized protein
MQLNEIDFGAAQPIEGYGPDFYRLGGTVHPAPVVFTAGHALPWRGYDDMEPLLSLAGHVDVLFIGTGPEIAPLPADLRRTLEDAGLAVEIMASAPACRTYNVLLSEGRRIAAALLPAG